MAFNLAERIEKLSTTIQPVAAEDNIAEAGRKILLAEFVKVLQHEEGSRSGADIEAVSYTHLDDMSTTTLAHGGYCRLNAVQHPVNIGSQQRFQIFPV